MHELSKADLDRVVRSLPSDVRDLMWKNQRKLLLAGGFIRAKIAGETPSDIDLFGPSEGFLKDMAQELRANRGTVNGNARKHRTKNAITVISIGRISVQFIHRWVFDDPKSCALSFDFTVCQSVVWVENNQWRSMCHPHFYPDLAARRLRYTSPDREEEAGGSLMRAFKFTKRGYHIPPTSLSGVILRVMERFDHDRAERSGINPTEILTGIIREVDPRMIIDGLDVSDDGEMEIPGLETFNA